MVLQPSTRRATSWLSCFCCAVYENFLSRDNDDRHPHGAVEEVLIALLCGIQRFFGVRAHCRETFRRKSSVFGVFVTSFCHTVVPIIDFGRCGSPDSTSANEVQFVERCNCVLKAYVSGSNKLSQSFWCSATYCRGGIQSSYIVTPGLLVRLLVICIRRELLHTKVCTHRSEELSDEFRNFVRYEVPRNAVWNDPCVEEP